MKGYSLVISGLLPPPPLKMSDASEWVWKKSIKVLFLSYKVLSNNASNTSLSTISVFSRSEVTIYEHVFVRGSKGPSRVCNAFLVSEN